MADAGSITGGAVVVECCVTIPVVRCAGIALVIA